MYFPKKNVLVVPGMTITHDRGVMRCGQYNKFRLLSTRKRFCMSTRTQHPNWFLTLADVFEWNGCNSASVEHKHDAQHNETDARGALRKFWRYKYHDGTVSW